jgi:hypothetical protein
LNCIKKNSCNENAININFQLCAKDCICSEKRFVIIVLPRERVITINDWGKKNLKVGVVSAVFKRLGIDKKILSKEDTNN